jgi:2-keto-4-pentenoate hydratase/2-oxohepta-3-ene-1,7-dioic acid hydratase in catechol pathway
MGAEGEDITEHLGRKYGSTPAQQAQIRDFAEILDGDIGHAKATLAFRDDEVLGHAAEIGEEVTAEPLIFFKPSSAIIGHGEAIVIPPQSKQVELEAELTLVIGKLAKNVSEEDALDYLWGYTIANDVTARDLQFGDGQWARSKGFDTFCPLGPWVETEFLPDGQVIESRINGDTRQNVSISKMTHNIRSIVSYVSKNMTLVPGDIILTGSPAGISQIKSGDLIECEIEGIGILANSVI